MLDADVIVAGAGPVGLAAASELGWRGVRTLVLDRRPPAARRHPTANHVSRRTMEHLRRWGLADRIRFQTFPADYPDDRAFLTEIGGNEIVRFCRPPASRSAAVESTTPESEVWAPKQYFDPIIEEHVKALPSVEVSCGWNIQTVSQQGDCVEVTATRAGETRVFRSRYLVACDGANSLIRQLLGIKLTGLIGERMGAQRARSFFLRSAQLKHLLPAPATQYFVVGRRHGSVIAINGEDLWRVHTRAHTANATAQDVVREFIGNNVDLEILSDLEWTFNIAVAERYREGRIFLAGDAAHQSSAYGGMGQNTGIGDAVDISWKLAACLNGWGGDVLLDSYDVERRRAMFLLAQYQRVDISGPTPREIGVPPWHLPPLPTAAYLTGHAGAVARRQYGAVIRALREREFNNVGLDLGHTYEGSPVVIADGTDPPRSDITAYHQTSRPGARAPHAWLEDGRSTLDLFGAGFTLLVFSTSSAVGEEMRCAAAALSVPLKMENIQNQDIAALFERRYVLVRPDGYVAWRGDAPPRDYATLLHQVCGMKPEGAQPTENTPAGQVTA